MKPVVPADTAGLIDLAGRILLTHAIDPEHAARALRIDRCDAEAMICDGHISCGLDPEQHERLRLFVNILMRLEWRFNHEAAAIRYALEAPSGALGGASPAALLGGTMSDLHRLRLAVESLEAPKTKWWRVGH